MELNVMKPDGWDYRHTGEICESIVPGRNKPKKFDGDIPWITIPDLDDGRVVSASKLGLNLSQDEIRATANKIVPAGSVIMSCVGDLGIVARSGRDLVMNQQLHGFVPKSEVDPDFLMFTLQNSRKILESMATKTTIQYLNKDSCNSIPILLPTKKEQEAIASSLSDVDKYIESLEKQISKTRLLKEGVSQALLSGSSRLPGFSGTWTKSTMGNLFHFSGGLSASRAQLSNKGISYLHYGDIHLSKKSYIDVNSELVNLPKLDIPLSKVSSKSVLEDGDIVFVDASEDEAGVSKCVVIDNPESIPFVSGLHTIVAKSKAANIDIRFKRYCFQSPKIKKQFRFYAVGTKVLGISKTNIAKIEIELPSTQEQIAIASVLVDIDNEIQGLEYKLDKTQMLKQGMMLELLTGRIRLV